MLRKKIQRRKLLNFLGGVLLLAAIVLLCLALLFQDPTFLAHYDDMMRRLAAFEYAVATLPYRGLVIVAIFLLYLMKSFVPLPISAICVIAGMAFPTPYAILINVAGFFLLCSIKYVWGRHLGGGFWHRLLLKNDEIERILEKADNRIKGGMLLGLRLVPSMPMNTVSQVYGAMGYRYRYYILLTMTGSLPRIVSYSFIGRNVYDPFSMAFILPFVILFTISGLSLFGVNHLIDVYKRILKNRENNNSKS